MQLCFQFTLKENVLTNKLAIESFKHAFDVNSILAYKIILKSKCKCKYTFGVIVTEELRQFQKYRYY